MARSDLHAPQLGASKQPAQRSLEAEFMESNKTIHAKIPSLQASPVASQRACLLPTRRQSAVSGKHLCPGRFQPGTAEPRAAAAAEPATASADTDARGSAFQSCALNQGDRSQGPLAEHTTHQDMLATTAPGLPEREIEITSNRRGD